MRLVKVFGLFANFVRLGEKPVEVFSLKFSKFEVVFYYKKFMKAIYSLTGQ